MEKLRKGPKKCLSARIRSKINKIINYIFEKAESLKFTLRRNHNKEHEGYLDKKERKEEEAKTKAFWKHRKNHGQNSRDFPKFSSLLHRLVSRGKVGPSLTPTPREAEEPSRGSTPVKQTVVCGPQEAFEEITPTPSADTPGETKVVKSPGDILTPWLTDHQSCPDIKGPFIAGAPKKIRSTIRRHNNATLLIQEQFQLLSSFEKNIYINDNITWKSYLELKTYQIKAEVLLNQGLTEEALVMYHKFSTLLMEKLRKGPKKCLSARIRSKINKIINYIFEKAESLKFTLRRNHNKEHEGYLDKKKRKEEEAKTKAFWKHRKNHGQNSRDFPKFSSLLHRLVSRGKVGPSLTPTPREAEEPSGGSTPVKQTVVCGPQEAFEEITPTPSADTPGETKVVKSPVPNSKGLRPVILPKDLWDRFLHSAKNNTEKGIETCGVLCGTLEKEEYHITHVIIPLQSGEYNYCSMEKEEELLFVQEELGLLTLGWIHTHPTQTAFLSSVDLHTHFGYQKMLPESIAVVCAPKYKQVGIFTLTPYGLKEISFCPQRGFHSHNQDSALFCDCSHVTIQNSLMIHSTTMLS
ncbi:STAM-binding protein-like isoform X3 [Peromyscus californicus insignis]|nr:STAM-binding protein-like isoform X3 [Peromyscus californicus insignis]